MKNLINQLEPHCQDGMKKGFFDKLKKVQKFKIGQDGLYLRGLLQCFFAEEKDKMNAIIYQRNKE